MTEFQCEKTKECIRKSYYCNAVLDCGDGSDEKYCPKPTEKAAVRSSTVSDSDDSVAVIVMAVIVILLVLSLVGFFGFRVWRNKKSGAYAA